jgi:hypothetical protein
MSQASLATKSDPDFRITRAKRAEGAAQVVEHLVSRPETMSSKPSTNQKKGQNHFRRQSILIISKWVFPHLFFFFIVIHSSLSNRREYSVTKEKV